MKGVHSISVHDAKRVTIDIRGANEKQVPNLCCLVQLGEDVAASYLSNEPGRSPSRALAAPTSTRVSACVARSSPSRRAYKRAQASSALFAASTSLHVYTHPLYLVIGTF